MAVGRGVCAMAVALVALLAATSAPVARAITCAPFSLPVFCGITASTPDYFRGKKDPVCLHSGTLCADKVQEIAYAAGPGGKAYGAENCHCNCPVEWKGTHCQEVGAQCSQMCRNGGTCSGLDVCACTRDWTGQWCDEAVCLTGCNVKGGECPNSPNTCFCKGEHTGKTCNECKPGFYLHDDTLECVPKLNDPNFCRRLDSLATYDSLTENCQCSPLEWWGLRCQKKCTGCKAGAGGVGTYVTGGCIGLVGPTCSTCSKCVDGQTYQAGGCDGSPQDTICNPCNTCPVGTYAAGGCTDGADTNCAACTTCAAGKFNVDGCDGILDSVCDDCLTACPPGQFIKEQCTPTRDIICTNCAPCPAGTVTVGECEAGQAPVCIGEITVPTFPQVEVDKAASPIKFVLGNATARGLSIIISGLGLDVQQAPRKNNPGTDPNFGAKMQSFDVLFPAGTTEASIIVTPRASGLQPVTFAVGGADASQYVSLQNVTQSVNGLIPTPAGAQTVWQMFNINPGQYPQGTNTIDVAVITGGKKIRFASTSTWTALTPTIQETCGAVEIQVGSGSSQVRVPVSIRGIIIDTTSGFHTAAADKTRCGAGNSLSDLFEQQLSLAASLPDSFFGVVASIFPNWLKVDVPASLASGSSSPFDFQVQILLGSAAQGADPACGSLPVDPTTRYATILWGKPATITVDSDVSNMPSGANFCFLVDVSKNPGSSAMVGIPKAGWDRIQNLQFKKNLEAQGWMLGQTDIAFCFPGCFNISNPSKYWNGDEVFTYNLKKGNFWFDTSLEKKLLEEGNAKTGLSVFFELGGNAQLAIDNPNVATTSEMFSQGFEGLITGRAGLRAEFRLFGLKAAWKMEAKEASVLVSLDGRGSDGTTREVCGKYSNPAGIFFHMRLDSNQGLGKSLAASAIGEFIGLGSGKQTDIDAFILYQSKRVNGNLVESAAGFGIRIAGTSGLCVLPGALCYKFQYDLQVSDSSLLRRCDRFREVYAGFSAGKVLAVRGERRGTGAGGFFVGNTGVITFAMHTTESEYLVRFTTGCNIMLIPIEECTVFVGNFPDSLFLQVNLFSRIFGLFRAELDVKAVLPSNLLDGIGWLTMPIRIRARVFDFAEVLVETVSNLVKAIADAILERLEAFERVVESWEDKIDEAEDSLKKLADKLMIITRLFDSAEAVLKGIEDTLNAVKKPLEAVRDQVDKIIRQLDRMCKIRTCRDICIPGCGCCKCRRRRGSDAFGLIAGKAFSKTSLLRNKPAAQAVLSRERRWGCIPRPYCSSCQWKIPNIPCIIANAICKALRIPILILLQIVKAAVSALIAAVDAVQKLVDAARAVLDKLRFLEDLAKIVVKVFQVFIQVLRIGLAIARTALSIARQALAAALKFALEFVTQSIPWLITVNNVGFELTTIGGIAPRKFGIFIDLELLGGAVDIDLAVEIDFSRIFSAILKAASGIVDRFIKSVFGRRRRYVYGHVDYDAHKQVLGMLGFEFDHERHARDLGMQVRAIDLPKHDQGPFNPGHVQHHEIKDWHRYRRADQPNATASNSTDLVQPTGFQVFQLKCMIFSDAANFLVQLTDEIEIRQAAALTQMNDTAVAKSMVPPDDVDPMQYYPAVDQMAFDDDPLVNSLVINHFQTLNTTAVALNASQDEEVLERRGQAQGALDEGDDNVNRTDSNEYQNMLGLLQDTNNGTGLYAGLECDDIPDCVGSTTTDLAELFLDLDLPPEFAYITDRAPNMTAVGNVLKSGNTTLSDAAVAADFLVDFIDDIIDSALLCGRPPAITVAPVPVMTVFADDTLTLECNATASPAPAFRWYKDMDPEPLAETRLLTLDPVLNEHAGTYHCEAFNHIDFTTSNASQLIVLGGAKAELVLYFSFPEADFREAVGNLTGGFAEAVNRDVSTLINVDFLRVTQIAVSPAGEVSHALLPPLPGSFNDTTEFSSDDAVRLLRQLVRFSELDVVFGNVTLTAKPTSFRREFCRVPCQIVGTSAQYGASCRAPDFTCPLGPGSCRYSCPLNYVFQSGQAQTCRASHQFSGFDGLAYCRRANDPPTGTRYTPLIPLTENLPAGTLIGEFSSKDTDALQTTTYSLPRASDRQFLNVSADGSVVVLRSFNHEVQKSILFILNAADDGLPSYSEERPFTIAVEDVNEAPTLLAYSGSPIKESAPIGALLGILSTADPDTRQSHSYTLLDDAGGLVMLSGNRVLLARPLDYENSTGFNFTVLSTDSGSPAFSVNATFSVPVTNVNEAPTIDFVCAAMPCIELDRSSAPGLVLGSVVVSDPDANSVLTIAFVDMSNGHLAYDPATKELKLAKAVSVLSGATLEFGLTVLDDGAPMLSNQYVGSFVNLERPSSTPTTTGTTTATTTQQPTKTTTQSTVQTTSATTTVTIRTTTPTSTPSTSQTTTATTSPTTTPRNNRPAAVVLRPGIMLEGLPPNTLIGDLSTVDLDEEQTHTYMLNDDQGGRFVIVDGQLLTGPVRVDYESIPVVANGAGLDHFYQLSITTTDNGVPPEAATKDVFVKVFNRNEPPTLSLNCIAEPCFTISETAVPGTEVGVVRLSDPDNAEVGGNVQDLTLEFTDLSGGFLTILSDKIALAKPWDASAGRELAFSLRVTDEANLVGTDGQLQPALSQQADFRALVGAAGGSGGSVGNISQGSSDSGPTTLIIIGVAVVVVVLAALGFAAYTFRRKYRQAALIQPEHMNLKPMEERRKAMYDKMRARSLQENPLFAFSHPEELEVVSSL